MSNEHDGGPAFPEGASGPYANGEIVPGLPGMTVLDYAAIHADLSGFTLPPADIYAYLGETQPDYPSVADMIAISTRATAKIRYDYGAAMVAERNKRMKDAAQ